MNLLDKITKELKVVKMVIKTQNNYLIKKTKVKKRILHV